MPTNKQRIAIVGSGWAGLAAAVELASQQYAITVFESSPQLGGRARSIQWNGMTLDNGQHLMIGAYHEMLSLLHTCGADADKLFKRLSHRMLMLDTSSANPTFDLLLPQLPAPFHLLMGILKTPYLSFKEKLQVLIRFNKLLNTPITDDCSVSEWLACARLPDSYRKNVLEPVCLAALTTHPQQASARAFQSVLQQTFNAPAHFTDLLIPTTNLGQTFPAQAERYILQQGGEIKTRSKIQALGIKDKQINTVTIENQQLEFDQVILATPPGVTAKLLANIELTTDICQQIKQLKYEPIATLYLQFAGAVTLPAPMTGIINGLAEWVFERSISGHENVLAVVISAQGKHLDMTQDNIVEQVSKELKTTIPGLPTLLDSKLIIEKRATIQCHPGVDKYRPGINTPLINLKLCGDYVYIEENNQPGLPSTLEGALRSGVKCAQILIKQLNQ